MTNVKTMAASQFHETYKADPDITVIDVRTGAEYGACHVKGAELHPLQELSPQKVLASSDGRDAPLYVLCKGGGRAKKAADMIAPYTDRDVIVVEGGTDACVACGMPINQSDKAVMSLERQVRIAAGTLVVLGAVLGTWVDPGFHWLSAFVGAGLAFAGLTDTCAMGMLIARMPWNKASA